MGEASKRTGEIGEEIVKDFLKMIGWINPRLNFDIPSIDPEKHQKKTNGIDGFFHYKNPMITNTIENIIFSVKFSSKKYPNNPVPPFKDHYTDLAMAIESFKKSEIRSNVLNMHSNIESTFERGILFWINNIPDENTDISKKLIKIEIPKGYTHDGIILVDNVRMDFIFDSIQYVNSKYPKSEFDIEFTYFNTGMNNDDANMKGGEILPVQYLSSNIIPFRIQHKLTREVTLLLCTNDHFEDNELIKLMGLAKNIGTNYQAKTVIAFPDYNKLKHEHTTETVKQTFEDLSFIKELTVENFNKRFIA